MSAVADAQIHCLSDIKSRFFCYYLIIVLKNHFVINTVNFDKLRVRVRFQEKTVQ